MRIVAEGVPEVALTRSGFITNYPNYRYWHEEAVQEILQPKPLNLYIHIPYCVQRCAYCHYKTTTLAETRRPEIDRYMESVYREIALASQRFELKERPVTTVYLGGGTPTLLSEATLSRLMEVLQEHFTLADPEFNVEAEPVTLTPAKAAALRRLAVNRVSVGIQSFRDEIVLNTGRHNKEEHSLRAIELAKETGAVVNIDLLSGLAGETHDSWAYTVERALSVEVHSVTVYKMELYANTEYYAGIRQGLVELPSDEMELEFMRHAMERLEAAGYRASTFFTFTKEGRHPQRHVMNRFRGEDLYAFGVSAFGSLSHWSYQNTNDLLQYSAALESGRLPIQRAYVLNDLDRMVRDVVLGMKLTRLDVKEFKKRHGVELGRLCAPTLQDLEERGFIEWNDGCACLTFKGRLYGDYVGKTLGACLEALGPAAEERRALA